MLNAVIKMGRKKSEFGQMLIKKIAQVTFSYLYEKQQQISKRNNNRKF